MSRTRALSKWGWAAVGVLTLCLVLTAWRYRLPDISPADAEGFSSERAMETLKALIPKDSPRPSQSPEHLAMVQRLIDQLEDMGLEVETQLANICSPPELFSTPRCGDVQNVLVHFPGRVEDTILFTAHTDSVPMSPGAGDDGQGVAILVELASKLQRMDTHNSVTLLFTDGEERGLLGATAFAEQHPLAQRAKVAVNLEARGQSGLSTLFRTAGQDAWLIALYAQHAKAPFTSSVHQVVFETMPHYTDLSIWQHYGIPGVDFAFIDSPEAYHSMRDTVDRLDPRSVQSQGDNALAMLEGLSDADLSTPTAGHAAWFDILGITVLHWPRDWTPWLCLSWLAIVLGLARRQQQAGALNTRQLMLGMAWAALHLVGSIGASSLLIKAPMPLEQWPKSLIVVGVLTLWSTVYARLTPRLSIHAGLFSTSLFLLLLSLPLSLYLPGIAHLFALPTLGVPLAYLLLGRKPAHCAPIAALVGLCIAAVLWFPLLEGVRVALGAGALLPTGAGFGLVLLWALPLWRPEHPIAQ